MSRPTTLRVRVMPGAKRNEILGFDEGVLRAKLAAPPIEGRANSALVALLAEVLGIPKSRLEVVKGATARAKVVAVEALSESEVKARVEAKLQSQMPQRKPD